MEPLLGGKLVDPPPPIQEIWDTAANKRTSVDWALQWLWNQPEVSVVLSGMSTMPQVEENIVVADRSSAGILTPKEMPLFDQVRSKYQALTAIPCTSCDYCLPCPNGVNIPANFGIYNEGLMYDKPDGARRRYGFVSENERASACIQCLECEEKCPQSILISEWMPVVHEVLGGGKSYRKYLLS